MGKIISGFLLLAMALHLWKPFGLPGLRRRADFWKIAVGAFVIWTLALMMRP